jgi:hypothetical protein
VDHDTLPSVISPAGYIPENVFDESLNLGIGSDLFSWQSWPGELSDSIMWSAQFLDPAYNLQSHGPSFNGTEVAQFRHTGDDGQHGNFS